MVVKFRPNHDLKPRQLEPIPEIIGFNDKVNATGSLKTVCILDTETTGLDTRAAEIIEFAYMLVTYDETTGRFYDVVERFQGFQDASRPLSDEIIRITGITDQMIAGQRIDWSAVSKALSNVDIFVAHNAGFDRKILERYHDIFKTKPWGCSLKDADWGLFGESSRKQEWLVYKVCNRYYEAHRALDDVNALACLLATDLPESPNSIFKTLLQSAAADIVIIEATNSAFEEKDALKQLKFRWNANKRVWWTYVRDEGDNVSEAIQKAKHAAPSSTPETTRVPAIDKYSVRANV